MAQSLEQFTKNLLASGLPFAAEFEEFLKTLPAPKRPADGEQCARLLVKEKKLSAHQVQEIYAGRGKKLVVGNYVIHDKLGQGGMGMVLKAEHKRMGRMVALKVMSAAGMQNPDAVKRFQREVQAAAKLTHPNIVTAFDADEATGQHFLVMEYVEGSDLSQLVKKSGPLSVEKALHCILQAARGLEFAHQKGVVHRDIKPANLLLDGEGTVKILDMGLARMEHTAEQAELTGTGQIMGTVDYMAPEQAMSTRSADARADIYSLGITLWYLLTGRVAYDGETLMAKLMAHSSGAIPSLAAINPNVPPALDNVFRRMAAKTPAERYQSMTEVIAALERCQAGKADIAPTVHLPSEDSKLSEFLHNIGGKSPSRSGIGSSGAAPAAVAAPATNAGLEQTIVSSGIQSDTDPQTRNLPRAKPLPTAAPAPSSPAPALARPDKPWHADWRIWAMGGGGFGGVLLLGLILFLLTRGSPPVAKGPNTGQNTKRPSGSNTPLPPPGGNQPAPLPPLPQPGPSPLPAAAGDYALRFAPGDKLEAPNPQLDPGKPFTVEAYVTPGDVPPGMTAILEVVGVSGEFHLRAAEGRWHFYTFHGAAQASVPIVPNRRVHLAGVRTPTQRLLYVDGKLAASVDEIQQAPETSFAMRHPLSISLSGFDATVDEVRLSQSIRYDQEFTPEPRLTADAQTLALYHLDEGTGDTVGDSSGNNRHGKITGAKWVPAASHPARPNFALDLDGQDDYVDIPSLTHDGTSPFTLEAWATPAELRSGHVITLHSPDRTLSLYQEGDCWHGARATNQQNAHSAAEKSIQVGRPQHVAFVWDGRVPRVFVNGRAFDNVRNTSGGNFNRKGGTLGGLRPDGLPGGSRILFRGKIDEVRVSKIARYDKDFPPPGPDDRFLADADTLALYHCDENTGDVLRDSSGNNHHGKIVGAKWVSAAPIAPPAVAGGGGLAFDGAASHVVVPTLSRDEEGPITLEAFLTVDKSVGSNVISLAGKFPCQMHGWPGPDPVTQWVPNGADHAGVKLGGGTTPLIPGKRAHVAFQVERDSIRMFVDGKLANVATRNSPPGNGATRGLLLGCAGDPGGALRSHFFSGKLEEIRISKILRYTANFTPSARHAPDADTLALYHCDEGAGDVLKDSSGNNHHGKIVGAKWVKGESGPIDSNRSFLRFGGDAFVELPTLKLAADRPTTFEAWTRSPPQNTGVLVETWGPRSFTLFRDNGFWKFGQRFEGKFDQATSSAVDGNRLVHLAGVWDGTRSHLFVDGLRCLEKQSGDYSAHATPGAILGAMQLSHGRGNYWTGDLFSLRVSAGVRYSENFVAPRTLVADKDTIALYACDDGQGETLRDSSGNNHHGKIVGAKWGGAGPTAAPTPIPEPPANPGLIFAAREDRVTATLAPTKVERPLTVEAWLTLHRLDGQRNIVQLGSGVETYRLWLANKEFLFGYTAKPNVSWAGAGHPRQPGRYHVAGTWDAGSFRMYVDGKLTGALKNDQPPGFAPDSFFAIGNFPKDGVDASPDQPALTIHSLRITKARYTAGLGNPFTPPAQFTADADTLALYQFDEGQGDLLRDSSGNKRDGKIVGAKWVSVGPPASGGPAMGTWRPLFNGKDLTGWMQMLDQAKAWRVEDGELVAESAEAKMASHLASRESFGDFDLRAEVLFAPNANSGIFFRTPGDYPQEPHEIEIGGAAGAGFRTGDLCGSEKKSLSDPVQPNEWATIELFARGSRFLSKVNGKWVGDWTETNGPATGKIALQCLPNHAPVRFRRIEIRVPGQPGAALPAVPAAGEVSAVERLTSPNFEWTAPENLGPVNSPGRELAPSLTDDERTLVFVRDTAIFTASRATRDDPFGPPIQLSLGQSPPPVKDSASISGDGLLLAFISGGEVWMAERPSLTASFGEPVPLPAPVNLPGATNRTVFLADDGLGLYVCSARPGKLQGSDAWLFWRAARGDAFGRQANLGPNVNTAGMIFPQWATSDGRLLLSLQMAGMPWAARFHLRPAPQEAFGPGTPLGPPFDVTPPGSAWLSPAGDRIYFHARDLPGGKGNLDLWMCRRVAKKAP